MSFCIASRSVLHSFCRSFCPSVLLSFCPSVLLSFCPSVLLSFCPSVLLSFCPSVLLSCCPAVLLSFCPSVLLSFCPSVLLSFCPSVLLSFCPSVPLSFFLSFCLFVASSKYYRTGGLFESSGLQRAPPLSKSNEAALMPLANSKLVILMAVLAAFQNGCYLRWATWCSPTSSQVVFPSPPPNPLNSLNMCKPKHTHTHRDTHTETHTDTHTHTLTHTRAHAHPNPFTPKF